ncbi:hypothetical protein DRJ16_01785 [Candidatus Woesearchaeota archaeon]|nr:hypothetical protein [Candidatus Woesearchaeota archaeon]RLE44645.1 MAG: hypothetical protein DRJ16_01785 [Candidatus Woesearchaeota archaeon]
MLKTKEVYSMAKIEIEEEMLKEVENDIRDLINWIEVWNEQEKTGGTKLIEDEQAEKMKEKLRSIAEKLGLATL